MADNELRNFITTTSTVAFADGVTAARLNKAEVSRTLSPGISVDVLRFAAGALLPEHVHPERDHSLIVISGLGWVSIMGDKTELEKGDVIDIIGADIHAIGSSSQSDFEVLSIGSPPADLFSPDRMRFVDGLYQPKVIIGE